MRPIKVITDSCSDLPEDLRDKYDIDYARMCTVYEGKETSASLDWEYYTPQELYGIMRAGNRVLTTQVPVHEFERIFTEYLEKGFDIIYIGCCLKQSSSVNTGAVTAEELLKKYPGARIACVDSLNASIGEGMLAIRASEKVKEGMEFDALCSYILGQRNMVNEYCTVHTLDALKRAGRVKGSAAFFGNLMGVKPIIISDANGEQTPVKKVKGRKNSLDEIIKMTKESIIDPEKQTIYIGHADCNVDTEITPLVEKIKAEIPCKDVHVSYIGPIIGSSIGPDAVVICSWGKEVTYEV